MSFRELARQATKRARRSEYLGIGHLIGGLAFGLGGFPITSTALALCAILYAYGAVMSRRAARNWYACACLAGETAHLN